MNNNQHSLKQRITKPFALFVVSVMGIMTVAVAIVLGLLLSGNLEDKLHDRAVYEMSLLQQRLDFLLESTQGLARNGLVINGMTDASGRAGYLPKLAENFGATRNLHSLVLVDFDAKPLYSTLAQPPDYKDVPTLRSVFAQGFISAYVSPKNGRLVIMAPIEYYRTTLGALVVEFDLAAVAQRILPRDNSVFHHLLGPDGTVYINNRGPDESYLVASQTLSEESLHPAIRSLGLSLEIGAKKSDYLAPVYIATIGIAFLGLLFSVAAYIVATRIGRSIADPILLLCRRVEQADGRPEHHCAPIGTGDELETLARLFDERTSDLLSIQNNLEQLVRERTAQLDRAQKIARIGSWQWNISSGRMQCSDEFFLLYGFEPQSFELTYETFLERVHPEDRDAMSAALNECISRKTDFTFEFRICMDVGDIRHLQARANLEFAADGNPVSMIGTVQDITERVLEERSLAESRRVLEQIAAREDLHVILHSIVELAETLVPGSIAS
ncbi:MAG: PAS domain-containing protein, partial [Gallionellaceae bacterium]|nr:PAS domain-containing protein [Gallionellaceae bacterium]